MFYEFDRLAREEAWEARVPTETYTCPKCQHRVRFTAAENRPVRVTCPHCGYRVEVVVESQPKRVA